MATTTGLYHRMDTAAIPAQGTAGTTQNTLVGEVDLAATVAGVDLIANTAVVFHATNYRTFTLYNRGSDGTGTTVIATVDTSTTGFSNNDKRAMTLTATAADLIVAAGDVLELVETVAASGVAHGGFLCRVKLSPNVA